MTENNHDLIELFINGVAQQPGAGATETDGYYCPRFRHFTVHAIGAGSVTIQGTLQVGDTGLAWVDIAEVTAGELITFTGIFSQLRAVKDSGASTVTALMRRGDDQQSSM